MLTDACDACDAGVIASAAQALTGVTGWSTELVAAVGAPGVGLMTFVETLIPPLPGDAVLPLSGFLSQQDQLSLFWVLVASTCGSVAGSWALYGMGRWLGLQRVIGLLARLPLIDSDDVERMLEWFERRGAWAVFFGRFVPGVGAVVSVAAGVQRMSPLVFTLGTAAATLSWNAGLVGLGYTFPARWEVVGDWVATMSVVVVTALTLCVLVAALHHGVQRRRSARDQSRLT